MYVHALARTRTHAGTHVVRRGGKQHRGGDARDPRDASSGPARPPCAALRDGAHVYLAAWVRVRVRVRVRKCSPKKSASPVRAGVLDRTLMRSLRHPSSSFTNYWKALSGEFTDQYYTFPPLNLPRAMIPRVVRYQGYLSIVSSYTACCLFVAQLCSPWPGCENG